MPMVSEHSQTPDARVTVSRADATRVLSVATGRIRTQYGYRSRNLSTAEELSIKSASDEGHVKSLIHFYDEVGGFDAENRRVGVFNVNDRDYSEMAFSYGQPKGDTLFADYWKTRLKTSGIISITGVTPGYIPAQPSDAVISSIAGSLMRRTAPARSEIDLTRSIGELKDVPPLLKASTWHPRTIREAAGTYLAMVFGVSPSISDATTLLMTVVDADRLLKHYVAQERAKIRRSATHVIWESSDSGISTAAPDGMYSDSGPVLYGGVLQTTVGRLLPSYAAYTFMDVLIPHVSWSYTARQSVRSFATYEYFIPKPEGLDGRLSRYRQLAERLLGGGLTLSTMYDLTPWSWLVDWFADVGGLLHYQQQIVDNQLVASNSGFSVMETLEAQATFTGRHYDASHVVGGYGVISDSVTPGTSTFRWKKHRRRPGNPYSIGPTWDLSRQQWAILGALGLSRSEGVPFIKRM